MHRVDWNDLQYIRAVAESGSVAAAARTLGVNHATVLRRIANFEARHDTQLFERLPTGYRLVREQAQILNGISAIGSQVERIGRMIAGQETGFGGTLTLTTTDSLSEVLVKAPLAAFRKTFPDVHVTLAVTNQRLDLARLDADIAIRPSQALPDGFVGRRIADLNFRPYRPVGYDAPLDGQVWIGPDQALERSPVAEWMAANVPEKQIAMRANSFVAMAGLAEAGFGMTMIPSCLGDARPGLLRAATVADVPRTGIWVAAHRDRLHTARMQAFLDCLAEALTVEAPKFEG